MKKKGVGLSVNILILSVIGIIVMVLLVLIFTGGMRNFRLSTSDCQTKGGTCMNLINDAGDVCNPEVEECLSPCDRDNFEEEAPFACYDENNKKDTNQACCVRG